MKIQSFDSIEQVALPGINDLLMFIVPFEKQDVFHGKVKEWIREGVLTERQLENLIKRVIAAKLYSETFEYQETIRGSSYSDSVEGRLLEHELAAASLTVLKNDHNLIPVRRLSHLKVAKVSIGRKTDPLFIEFLNNYIQVDTFHIGYDSDESDFENIWTKLKGYDLIITELHDSEYLWQQSDSTDQFAQFQQKINESRKGIIVLFASPESLKFHENIMDSPSLIVAWEDNELYHSLVPQLIFGGIDASGTLPYASRYFNKGYGVIVRGLGRFSYTFPEAAGLNSGKLEKVDSIVMAAIRIRAIPGCQVLAVHNGKVVFRKAYGYHTYDSLHAVRTTDIYDLASVTKVSSALPCLMKLYDDGKFDLNARLKDYLPYFKNSNKGDITFSEILAHQAGLKPWIPYWKTTIK